ncbi:AMP-binding protein [Streptomyces sp. TP-A0356]|uniref:AMP-binding protein n=1 Tax=Streptomyces sp. TP-A0356 TaxID=1359208 RepID=UPI0006E3090C|nr:AMP-binding protein [Streptomyces sp. TP-A0356]
MTDTWHELLHGRQWSSQDTVWVEDGTEYSWADVSRLAVAVEACLRAHGPARVVVVRARRKLGCFAGQLGAWRAGTVAVADDHTLSEREFDRIRPDLTLTVSAVPHPSVEPAGQPARRLPPDRIPEDVVAVNFTSGSTGSRKAVAVTRDNLLALFACPDLDVPVPGPLTAGSFATPTYDGWWFDTWRTVAAGGRVVCLPHVNDDVFAWPGLARTYGIGRLLLPAAVLATVVEVLPEAVADIPWLFSGGEQFQVATYRQARRAGLAHHFVNLYGPTEATFATHHYRLPTDLAAPAVPIGRPLAGCRQLLRTPEGGPPHARELVVTGPFVCLGYLYGGVLTHRFRDAAAEPSYRTGDLVRTDGDGDLVFAGRLDGEVKVNGMRVDTAALEQRVTALPRVQDCRVVQHERHTVAFVRTDPATLRDTATRSRIETVVQDFSPAIGVRLVDRYPVKAGGKVDVPTLMDHYRTTDKAEET